MLNLPAQRAVITLIPVIRATGDGMVQTQRLFDLDSLFFLGDNLEMLRRFVPDESVDLIYLDPPFNSNATYNMLFKHIDGTPVSAQIKAFGDTWQWSLEAELAYKEVVEAGGEVSRAMQSFRELLGASNMLAYLAMMAPRLIELRRVLRPTGTLYLHCDPNASHYLKLLLDGIFGAERFRNEIVWQRVLAKGNQSRKLPTNHDCILVYERTADVVWNPDAMFQQYDLDDLDEKTADKYSARDSDGRRYQLTSLISPNPNRPNLIYEFMGMTRVWRWTQERMLAACSAGTIVQTRPGKVPRFKRYLDEQRGRPIGDVWTDIPPLNSKARERIGYPTQKPLALLERIIEASSNPGDTVLDPFCGCGTAVDAAQKLGRRWIGIDIAREALKVIDKRMADNHPGVHFNVKIIPTTWDEVDVLASRDKYGYQQWVCDLLGIKAEIRKGADRGIDGELVRYESDSGQTVRTVVSVKGGGVNVSQVRDLRGTMERESAQAGIFVSHRPPTAAMRSEALEAGLTESGTLRLQLLTSEDLIAGRLPQLPLPIRVGRLASDREIAAGSPPSRRKSVARR